LFFFSSRRRHTRSKRDWSSDVCSSDLLLDEAGKFGLGSTAHLDQMGVARMNARDAVQLGLGTVTHYYGIFEALLKDYSVQPYPRSEERRVGKECRSRMWRKQ